MDGFLQQWCRKYPPSTTPSFEAEQSVWHGGIAGLFRIQFQPVGTSKWRSPWGARQGQTQLINFRYYVALLCRYPTVNLHHDALCAKDFAGVGRPGSIRHPRCYWPYPAADSSGGRFQVHRGRRQLDLPLPVRRGRRHGQGEEGISRPWGG